jgi:hypothetical protein
MTTDYHLMDLAHHYILRFISYLKADIFITICCLILVSSPAAAKKRCDQLKQKIQTIQYKQRAGYSVKQGLSLDKKLQKARDNWWKCENTSVYHAQKKKTVQQPKSNKRRATKQANLTSVNNQKSISPFQHERAIVIKHRYQGQKLQAWLAFYKRPKKCQRPKSTQLFAQCLHERDLQQEKFEQYYQQHNTTP